MENIKLSIILEILGRPPENVTAAMNNLIEQLSKEKGVVIVSKKINDPIPVKDSKDLYTTFSEIDLEVASIDLLFFIAFKYMPSNFEITYPENLKVKNEELTQAINQLVQRLHSYDALAKNVVAERDFLAKRLVTYEPQLFRQQQNASQPENKVLEKSSKKQKKKKSKH
ncbi:MAG: hypothetical protein AABW80_01385 [Nanoarchaeota archaeon]